ncbi:MAG: LamG domain-containing protein [Bacteroidales bacterium]|nr:MAG: LamG domain-containing protein [Bacteroidales bacterium]
MRRINIIIVVLCLIVLNTCDEDVAFGDIKYKGKVSFSASLINGNTGLKSTGCDDLDKIAAAIVDIENEKGELVYDTERIEFYKFNDDYISDELSLVVGNYKLTKFLLIDSSGEVLFASPLESSDKSYLVENPLPIEFIIERDKVTKVIPEVLDVTESTPEDFGYVSFSFIINDLISFYITVNIFNCITESFEITDANLVITHYTDTLYNNYLEPVANSIIIRDIYNKYKINVFKSGFKPYSEFFTNDSLKYYNDKSLIIILEEESEPGAGPVAYYPFNGNAKDMSENNNDGIVYGATLVADRKERPNSAYYFDGINDHITIPSSPSLNPLNQLTIALWINMDTITNRYTPVIHKGGTHTPGFANREYLIYIEDVMMIYAESAGDESEHYFTGWYFPGLKEWFHFAVIFDRVGHKIRLYINGERIKEVNDSYSTFNNNNHSLSIATWEETHAEYAGYFKGYIDDIYIYDRVLSDIEIYDIFSE